MKKNAFILMIAAMLFSCQQSGGPISQADRKAIQQKVTDLEKAFRENSADGLKAVYASDVISMPPHAETNNGADKTVDFHTAPGPELTSFYLHSEEIEGSGDVAYPRGIWEFKGKINDSTEVSDNGKYLVIFRNQANKSWRLSRETLNSNFPMPGM